MNITNSIHGILMLGNSFLNTTNQKETCKYETTVAYLASLREKTLNSTVLPRMETMGSI